MPSTPEIPSSRLHGGPNQDVVEAAAAAADYLARPFEENALELASDAPGETGAAGDRILTGSSMWDTGWFFQPAHAAHQWILPPGRRHRRPVLLLGKRGVGKEVLSRYVHVHKRARLLPFVKVNCAALPQDLLESELFGYEKGAFSGAIREKPGMFELADRGTILLDEIGEMTPTLQAKLLHVLQDGNYTRLGGRHLLHADARVMASSNIELEEAVRVGRFREDLYYRLNVIRIESRPCAHQAGDIR